MNMMVSFMNMYRRKLITKEKMENYCKGKENKKGSINDDLESFYQDIRLGTEPDDMAFTYYLPKLTKEELKLVGRKDPIYLETFGLTDPDVDEIEMRMSESKSKFVEAVCVRRTLNCVLKP